MHTTTTLFTRQPKSIQQIKKERVTKMHTAVAEHIGGEFCVVVHTDGTSEVKRLQDSKTVFNEAKNIIGCKLLDHVILQDVAPDAKLEFLVNDNGYADWNKDPRKVNQIATFLYEGGRKPSHYILGDIVVCLLVDGEEGGDFLGINESLAEQIKKKNDSEILPMAQEIVPIPKVVPDPEVQILEFDSFEELLEHQRGYRFARPTEK